MCQCHQWGLCCDPFGLKLQVNEEQFYGEVENHCFCERHRTCKKGGDLDKRGADREKETIINLASHSEAVYFDHEFQSLTYQDALIGELNRYLTAV